MICRRFDRSQKVLQCRRLVSGFRVIADGWVLHA